MKTLKLTATQYVLLGAVVATYIDSLYEHEPLANNSEKKEIKRQIKILGDILLKINDLALSDGA